MDVIRLVDVFRDFGLYIGSIVLTQYTGQPAADLFKQRLEGMGLKVYRLFRIPDYPSNVAGIVSDEGFGRNDYVQPVARWSSSPLPVPEAERWPLA